MSVQEDFVSCTTTVSPGLNQKYISLQSLSKIGYRENELVFSLHQEEVVLRHITWTHQAGIRNYL